VDAGAATGGARSVVPSRSGPVSARPKKPLHGRVFSR